MNIILSDPKQGKAYSKKTGEVVFAGRKIGDTVPLDVIGLNGYKAIITGGSDKDGFPMKPTLEGQARKKLLMERGIGIRKKRKGERRRKRARANTVAQDIHQLNLKIIEYGQAKLSDIFKKAGGEGREEKPEKKGEKREEAGGKEEEKKGKERAEEKEEAAGKEAKAEEGKPEKGEKREEEKAAEEEEKKGEPSEKEAKAEEEKKEELPKEKAGEKKEEQREEGKGESKKGK